MVDLQKITLDLNRRFAAPLPEFYNRRIIFWKDEDREFEDKIGELELEQAKVLTLTGRNTFAAKKLLAVDDPHSNYLVYSPLPPMNDEDNWLLNIELYSEEFRADLYSIWMDEMGLPSNGNIRKLVKAYRKFFNNIDRRRAFSAQAQNITTSNQFHLAVLSAISGTQDAQMASILRAILGTSLDTEHNPVYQELVKYGAQVPFWGLVAQRTGYSEGDDGDLGHLAIHILLTAASRTLSPEALAGLDRFLSVPHQAFCYDLVSEWLRSDPGGQLSQVVSYVEDEAKLYNRFMKLDVEALVDTACFPSIDTCILTHLMKDIGNFIIEPAAITAVVEKRRTMAWYNEFACYYEGLLQVANMQLFYQEHAAGFHLAQAHQVWNAYTTDYYRMDTWYRLFHLAFERSLTASNAYLDDLFKQVADKVEGLYNHWFLAKLSDNWSDVCADEFAAYGYISEISRQNHFYSSKVASNDNRTYVIISDALRYEVAASLTEQLRRETQSNVTLESMQGIFPTITKFGMAALLPHTKLQITPGANGVAVLADSLSTEMPNRDKVLKNTHKNSVALQYKHIIKMKRAERQALVKGMDVVYIYHNKIDDASHVADSLVFAACDDAITEIKNLVRMIVNDFGGTRILITADHGFLYTYSPLTEDEKVSKASFSGHDIEYGRRYALLEKGTSPDYLMSVKLTGQFDNLEGFAPRGNVRIRMSGGGMNFVHGGISLQEMVVPVIDYQYLRNASKTYQRNRDKYDTKPVELNLLSVNRKISNMIFSLNFHQTEAVSDNRCACTYQLYFVDAAGRQISDMARIIADKTSELPQERTFRCGFNLKNLKFSNLENYYLVIADESGMQAPVKTEFQIDIAFALDDFNFFG